jgi:hypothetical protein
LTPSVSAYARLIVRIVKDNALKPVEAAVALPYWSQNSSQLLLRTEL